VVERTVSHSLHGCGCFCFGGAKFFLWHFWEFKSCETQKKVDGQHDSKQTVHAYSPQNVVGGEGMEKLVNPGNTLYSK